MKSGAENFKTLWNVYRHVDKLNWKMILAQVCI